MPEGDVDPLQVHDIRAEDIETHRLLAEVLARLPATEDDRRAVLLRAIAAVVRDEAFTVAEVYAFAEEAGPRGEPLRQALAGLSPKAHGKLLAKWAAAPAIVRASESSGDGVLWRVVGCNSCFAGPKSFAPKRPESATGNA